MLIHSESPERLIAGAFNDGRFNLGCDEKISKSFPAIRPTSKQNSRVISIKDNKPFYYFPRGGNIKFLAPAVVSVIFTESKIFFPPGSPDRTSCPDIGGPTRVSNPTSVKCARRSSPAATTCPNTSKCTASRGSAGRFAPQTEPQTGTSGNLCEPRNPSISGAGTWAMGAGRECTGLDAFGQPTGVRWWKHALSCCDRSLIYCQRAKTRDTVSIPTAAAAADALAASGCFFSPLPLCFYPLFYRLRQHKIR